MINRMMNTVARNQSAGYTLLALAICGILPFRAQARPQKDPVVEIDVAGRGKIRIELYSKEAPKTVDHFLKLCKNKFYDGILVHRVEPNFVVQAGDPLTKRVGVNDPTIGSHGSGPNGKSMDIPFERNEKTHEAGTIAMALTQPRSATGDSQWFINLVPNHRLDGDYCVFGKVTKGMEVVQKTQMGDKIVSIKKVDVK